MSKYFSTSITKMFCAGLTIMIVFAYSNSMSQKPIQQLTFDELEPYLHKNNDTVYLINFWATWCSPCRKEMPAIELIGDTYRNKKLKILLVSLDFPEQVESSLLPYIRENNLRSEVVILNDPRENEWITKVDPLWSGELPFTLLYGPGFRKIFTQMVTFDDLNNIIQSKLQ
jgi:thiol-disulfide isomerase/thioredoxin